MSDANDNSIIRKQETPESSTNREDRLTLLLGLAVAVLLLFLLSLVSIFFGAM